MRHFLVTVSDEPAAVAALRNCHAIVNIDDEVRYFVGYDCDSVVREGPSAVECFVLAYPCTVTDCTTDADIVLEDDLDLQTWADSQGYDFWHISERILL